MRLTGGAVFTPEGFFLRELCFENGRIVPQCGGETLDVSGCYVIPGLTDLHFHGCMGADFSDADPDGLSRMAAYTLSRGVTQICPAGMTLAPEQLRKVCATAAAYRGGGSWLCGVNLEGPFLSAAKKGAQNAAWLLPPDLALLRELQSASGGLVRLVTVAPELPGAETFIREASKTVTVSLGHTAADYDTAAAAFSAGARQVTHLFNAMPSLGHRAPGVVGAAFDCPGCMVELICDGIHIHPSVVRAVFRLFGPERVLLISDTMRAAGMPDGEYTLGGLPVRVRGARAELEDGIIAGSVTDLMAGLCHAVSFGIPLEDAVQAAACNPARVLGIAEQVGTLEPGKLANLAVLDRSMRLRHVFFHGQPVTVRP